MKIPRAWHGGLSMAAAARVSILWLCGVASSSLGSTNAVSICPYPEGKPSAVAFTFDDGIVEHDLVGAVELEKRGWRGTFNIIASAPGKRPTILSWEQIADLARRGHEIANHSMTHPNIAGLLKTAKYEKAAEETAGARDVIAAHAGVVPRTFCYPGNVRTDESDRFVEQSHLIAQPGDRIGVGAWTGPADADYAARVVAEPGRFSVFVFHGLMPDSAGWAPFKDASTFTRLLDGIKAKEADVHVGTFVEVAAYIRRRDHAKLMPLADACSWNAKDATVCQLELDPAYGAFAGSLFLRCEADGVSEVRVNGKVVVTTERDGCLVFVAQTGDVVALRHVPKGNSNGIEEAE